MNFPVENRKSRTAALQFPWFVHYPPGLFLTLTHRPSTMNPNSQPTMQPLLVTPHVAAKMLSVSERTLWSITAPRGDLACVRVGRSVRYSLAALRVWIDAQQADSVAASSPTVSPSTATNGRFRDEPAG